MRIEASALGYVPIRPLPSVLGRDLMQQVNCAALDARAAGHGRRSSQVVAACGSGLQPIRDRFTIAPIPAATDGPPCTPSA
jgi:hypothetical protein